MPGIPGPRTGLAQILSSGEAPTILRTTVNSVISWLEGNAMLTSSGLLSARPVSTPGTPGISGRRYYATDTGVEYRDTGTGWVALGVELVTTLPASPFNGQIIDLLIDATNGVVARLRYRAASASPYKWEAVGDAGELYDRISANQTTTSATYTDLATVGPSIVLPFAGDWDLNYGVSAANASAGSEALAAPVVPGIGATPQDTDAAKMWAPAGDTSAKRVSVGGSIRALGATAGGTAKLRYRSGGGTASFENRWLRARPVRVG